MLTALHGHSSVLQQEARLSPTLVAQLNPPSPGDPQLLSGLGVISPMERCWWECGCARVLGAVGLGQAQGLAGCECFLHLVLEWLGAGGQTGRLENKSKGVRVSPGLGALHARSSGSRLGRVGPAPLGASAPPIIFDASPSPAALTHVGRVWPKGWPRTLWLAALCAD